MNTYRIVPLTDDWQERDHRVYFRATTEQEAIEYAKAHYDDPIVTEAGFYIECLDGENTQ
jgi:hypothetical protein